MKENFLNLAKEIDMQVQEAPRIPNKIDVERPTPRHIIVKTPKGPMDKDNGVCGED